MPLDLPKYRAWARIPHNEDDPAILIAWQAAVRELEERTGWVVDPVTRTQYVPAEPDNEELLVLASRQPVTAATVVVDSIVESMTLVTVNGLQYFKMLPELTYPITVTLSVGSGTLNPLLEMALLQRVTQHAASRGDDTVALSSDYWDRISTMMGKGIG